MNKKITVSIWESIKGKVWIVYIDGDMEDTVIKYFDREEKAAKFKYRLEELLNEEWD